MDRDSEGTRRPGSATSTAWVLIRNTFRIGCVFQSRRKFVLDLPFLSILLTCKFGMLAYPYIVSKQL